MPFINNTKFSHSGKLILVLPLLAVALLFQTGCWTGQFTDTFQVAVVTDPANQSPVVQMPARVTVVLQELARINNRDTVQVTGPSPWITVAGPLNHDGTFSLTGTGTVAGVTNVAATFVGNLDQTGKVTGTYSMGTNGVLPGAQAIVYSITGPIDSVANTPLILPTPWIFQFPAKVGVNPPSQMLKIDNVGTGILGWTASTSTDSGGNWLSIETSADIHRAGAAVSVNSAGLLSGTYTGKVLLLGAPQGSVRNNGQTVDVQLAVGVPLISNNGTFNAIVNNANYAPGTTPLALGSIAAIFGFNLTDGTSCLPPSCNPTFGSDGKLGTTMAGAQVTINGTPVPIFYATPGQLGIQIPYELPRTTNAPILAVTVGGQSSLQIPIPVGSSSPGIFTVTADGKGAGAITHVDGSAVTTQNPAQRGEVVIIYATGLGPVAPAVPTGALPTSASSTVSPVTLTIGGINVIPDFAGLAGCCAGLNQINARVPLDATPGALPVVLSISGQSSNTATIAVQ